MTERSEDPRFALYRRNLDVLAQELADRDADIAGLTARLDASEAAAGTGNRHRRAAVLCSDAAASVRAAGLRAALSGNWDVDIVAPAWNCAEGRAPDLEAGPGRRLIPCTDFTEFYTLAVGLALEAAYDLVVIRGTRLPALLLGALIRKTTLCPVVLDLDEGDFATGTASVFEDMSDENLAEALKAPDGAARIICRTAVEEIPVKTAMHPGLCTFLNGFLVRSAPTEADFDPARVNRLSARQALGLAETDFAVVVPGPLPPDDALAETLPQLPDRRIVLHVLGGAASGEPVMHPPATAGTAPVIVLHPGIPRAGLPLVLAAADAVVLMAQPGDNAALAPLLTAVADAAAFGLPVLTDALPQLEDLARLGLVQPGNRAELPERLAALADTRAANPRQQLAAYRTELGPEVNAARMALAVDTAHALPPVSAMLDALAKTVERAWSARTPVAAPHVSVPAAIDIVMFWKQNDSGLYGRRADMLMKHLLASGRVGRILQFDAPLSVRRVARLADRALAPAGQHDAMILGNVIRDQYFLRDRPRHRHRTFLWSRDAADRRLLPATASSDLDFPAHVRQQIAAAGISASDALGWVYPVVPGFAEIAATIPFRGLVGDLVDDQRTMDLASDRLDEITRSYEETLPRLDLALTNCDAMVEAFSDIRPDIHVVPNGADLPPEDLAPHPDLARYPRPVAGYIGNLVDRVDWDLLTETARLLPGVSFVVIGGGQSAEVLARTRDLPNLHLHGAVPYAEAQAAIRAFDVALMPHVRSEQTDRMNPLKIYNYAAVGRPIVATEVANIDPALAGHIRFANSAAGFAEAVRTTLATPTVPFPEKTLEDISWQTRTTAILTLLEAAGLL